MKSTIRVSVDKLLSRASVEQWNVGKLDTIIEYKFLFDDSISCSIDIPVPRHRVRWHTADEFAKPLLRFFVVELRRTNGGCHKKIVEHCMTAVDHMEIDHTKAARIHKSLAVPVYCWTCEKNECQWNAINNIISVRWHFNSSFSSPMRFGKVETLLSFFHITYHIQYRNMKFVPIKTSAPLTDIDCHQIKTSGYKETFRILPRGWHQQSNISDACFYVDWNNNP